jgi:hypothetical protein
MKDLKNRTPIQYSRLELTHYAHEYFPKSDEMDLAHLGIALRGYCVDQDHFASYEGFQRIIQSFLPKADEKKIRGLFRKLFPIEPEQADLSVVSGKRSTTTVTRTTIVHARSFIPGVHKNHRSILPPSRERY